MTLRETASRFRLNDHVDACLQEGFPTDPKFLELFKFLADQQKSELKRYGSEPIVYYSNRDGSKVYHSHASTVRQFLKEGVLEFLDDDTLVFTEEFETVLKEELDETDAT